MDDGKQTPKRRDLAGPIILICVGVALLLCTTGVVPWTVWASVWRFWPVLLIIWGISAVFGRESAVGRIVLPVLLALILMFAISGVVTQSWWEWDRPAERGEAVRDGLTYSKTHTVRSDQFSCSQVRLKVDVGAGRVFIGTQSGGDILTAIAEYSRSSGAPRLDTSMSGSVLSIDYLTGHAGFMPFIFGRPDEHQLTLGRRDIPTQLDLKVGGGRLDAVLSGLGMTEASIEVGGGTVKIGFPEAPSRGPAAGGDWGARTLRFRVGAGTAEIVEIGNTDVQRLSGSIGSGTVYLDFSGKRLAGAVTGEIKVGAGKLELYIPADIGVRLDSSVGVGSLRVNGRQYGRRGLNADETWESANYSQASARLHLCVEAGAGSIEVTHGH